MTTLYDVDTLVMWAANHSAVVHQVRSLCQYLQTHSAAVTLALTPDPDPAPP